MKTYPWVRINKKKRKRKGNRRRRKEKENEKTKFLTTGEIRIFNIENEDIKIVHDFAYVDSVINLNGDCSQEIKRDMEGQQWKNWKRSRAIVCH